MNIYDLPGYHIEDDTMLQRYTESLKISVNEGWLQDHVIQWRAAWELWPRPTKAIIRILNFELNNDETIRLQQAINDKENFIPTENDELVTELIMPATFLVAFFIVERFEVPFCTALHQSFCELEDHNRCF